MATTSSYFLMHSNIKNLFLNFKLHIKLLSCVGLPKNGQMQATPHCDFGLEKWLIIPRDAIKKWYICQNVFHLHFIIHFTVIMLLFSKYDHFLIDCNIVYHTKILILEFFYRAIFQYLRK